MPFYGPPGTGKSSTIPPLSSYILGTISIFPFLSNITTSNSPANFGKRALQHNAFDGRGISIVREKIKNLARQLPLIENHIFVHHTKILDEADSMTQDARGARRRIMETYARITSFCLLCNSATTFFSFHELNRIY
jgi:replication factor C subunit 2/4